MVKSCLEVLFAKLGYRGVETKTCEREVRHFINPDPFSLKNLKNFKILKHFFNIFFYFKIVFQIRKNVCDVFRVCLESVVEYNYQFNPSVKIKYMKKSWKKWKIFCFARQKWNFRKNKKVSSNFLEFLLIFVFFCENFDFRKTSWCLLGLKEKPWRTETFCKKSTELGLSKKEVRSCLRILFAKLWHRWIWKKCAKMKKNMIFYSVFPRKKKSLKRLKNAQKCSKWRLSWFIFW